MSYMCQTCFIWFVILLTQSILIAWSEIIHLGSVPCSINIIPCSVLQSIDVLPGSVLYRIKIQPGSVLYSKQI